MIYKGNVIIYNFRYILLNKINKYTAVPSTKFSLDDGSSIRYGFRATASLPLAQSYVIVHYITRLFPPNVGIPDENATSSYSQQTSLKFELSLSILFFHTEKHITCTSFNKYAV